MPGLEPGIHAARLMTVDSVWRRSAFQASDRRHPDVVDGRLKSGHDVQMYLSIAWPWGARTRPNSRARPARRLQACLAAIVIGSLAATPASRAQVSMNPDALSQLPASPNEAVKPPAKHPAHRAPAHRQQSHATAAAASPKGKPAPATPARPPAAPAPAIPPAVAPAPPAQATLAPTPQASPHPASAPPPVPVVAGAVGQADAVKDGLRVIFGSGSSDLNQTIVDALLSLARQMQAQATSDVTLYSYSSGPSDDPSTPRRLALSRALAVRAVLISDGVASTRIYPRVQPPTAAGPASPAADPPDRVDAVVSTGAQGPAAKAP